MTEALCHYFYHSCREHRVPVYW